MVLLGFVNIQVERVLASPKDRDIGNAKRGDQVVSYRPRVTFPDSNLTNADTSLFDALQRTVRELHPKFSHTLLALIVFKGAPQK